MSYCKYYGGLPMQQTPQILLIKWEDSDSESDDSMYESIHTAVSKNEWLKIITRITVTRTRDTVIIYNFKEGSDGGQSDPSRPDNIRNDGDILVENHIHIWRGGKL